MNDVSGKPRQRSLVSYLFEHQSVTSQENGSHVVTLVQNLGETDSLGELNESQLSSDYHLTARLANSQLGQREISLICEVLLYQIVNFGVNFSMMIALSELYFRLLGQKRKASEINNGKVRTIVTIVEIILKVIGDFEFSLDLGTRRKLPEKIVNLVSPYLMNKRTYGSRYRSWRPERFIRVRAVPVEVIFERDSGKSSKRYSGYTKGYGESHGNAHIQKTKPSAELDGDQDAVSSEERNLIHRVADPEHQPANSLWIKFCALFGIRL